MNFMGLGLKPVSKLCERQETVQLLHGNVLRFLTEMK